MIIHPLHLLCNWSVYNSNFTTTSNSSSCPDMHLFMGFRLPWEWNIALMSYFYTQKPILLVTTQLLAHIHIVHRWEIVCNRYIRRHMMHTHGIKQPPHIFYTLVKISIFWVKLPKHFYGHFNMSSLCDIKYTLVRTERGERGRMEDREKQREREGEWGSERKSWKHITSINRSGIHLKLVAS